MAYILNELEQKQINEVAYLNKVGDGDITSVELLKILESTDREPGHRVKYINYYIGRGPKGKECCLIKSDDYNKPIIENLSNRGKAMHELTISGRDDVDGYEVLGKINNNGIYYTQLINIGTTKKPVWTPFPNIIVSAMTSGFSVRNVHKKNDPKRIIVTIKNSSNGRDKIIPFLSPGVNSIDNEEYNKCVKIVQEEQRICLDQIEALYKKCGPGEICLKGETISDSIFKTERLNSASPAALYKTVKSVAKKTSAGVTFTQTACDSEDEHYTQVRIGISQQTDESFWAGYHKGKVHGFSKKNIYVAAPSQEVHYRFCNTALLGKDPNSIINQQVMLTLKHSDKFGPAPEGAGNHAVYAYSYKRDKKLRGEDHQAFFEFPKCNVQYLNMVVGMKLYISNHYYTPSFDIVAGRPLIIVRLDERVFKRERGIIYDEVQNIEYGTKTKEESTNTTTTTTTQPPIVEEGSEEEKSDDDDDEDDSRFIPKSRKRFRG